MLVLSTGGLVGSGADAACTGGEVAVECSIIRIDCVRKGQFNHARHTHLFCILTWWCRR